MELKQTLRHSEPQRINARDFSRTRTLINRLTLEKVQTPQNSLIELRLIKWIIGLANNSGKLEEPKLPVLIGPPGVGKTYSLKKSVEVLKNISDFEEVDKEQLSEFKKSLEKLQTTLNSLKNEFISDEVKEETLTILRVMLNNDLYKNLDKLGKRMLEHIRQGIEELSFQLDNINSANLTSTEMRKAHDYYEGLAFEFVNNLKRIIVRSEFIESENIKTIFNSTRDIEMDLVVLPTLSSPKEVVSSTVFVQGLESGNFIERKKSLNILDIMLPTLSGKPVLLVLDEISELVKESRTKNIKNLHDFLDSVLNLENRTVKVMISPEEIMKKDLEKMKEIVKSLKEIRENETKLKLIYRNKEELERTIASLEKAIEAVENDEDNLIEIHLPITKYLYVFGTGNIRGEDSPVGFFESTENRVEKVYVQHIPPYEMNSFIERIARNLENEVLESYEGVDRDAIARKINSFSEELKSRYASLYNDYYEAKNSVNNLPSYRTIVHTLTTYASFLMNKEQINEVLAQSIVSKISMKVTSVAGSSNPRLTITHEKNRREVSNERKFSEFLIKLLRSNSLFNVSSFTFQAESENSKMYELELDGKMNEIFNTLMQGDNNLIYTLKFDKDQEKLYYFNENMMQYLAYLATNLMVNKKPFTLMIGTSQEGKTTLSKEFSSYLFKNAKIRTIVPEQFDLKSSNLENKQGKSINEPELLKTIKEASSDPENIYIVIVNEIDNKTFTQSLNSLLESGEVKIEGKKMKLNNLMIIGTMNVSTTILDNFLSRAGLALPFFPSISSAYIRDLDLISYMISMEEITKQIANKINELSRTMGTTQETAEKTVELFNEALVESGLSALPKKSEMGRIVSGTDFEDDWAQIIKLVSEKKEDSAKELIKIWLSSLR